MPIKNDLVDNKDLAALNNDEMDAMFKDVAKKVDYEKSIAGSDTNHLFEPKPYTPADKSADNLTKEVKSDVDSIDKIVAESKLEYNDLSKLKQKRLLKKVNKALKRNGSKLLTHEDMMKQLDWGQLEGVYNDIVMTVVTTLRTHAKVLDSEFISDKVRESDTFKELQRIFLELGAETQLKLMTIRSKHWSEAEGFRQGNASGEEGDLFVQITAEYIDLRTELLRILGNLAEPLESLLSLIKVNGLIAAEKEALSEDDDGNKE